jgi:Skp family chaperone for outer membrane proteins
MRLINLVVLALLGATPVFAQQPTTTDLLERGSVISPVLTIDSDRAYAESAFGMRVAAEVAEEGLKLDAENKRIQAELEAEEQELTDLRTTLIADEFRLLADAFDAKVQTTRAERTSKARMLNTQFSKQQEVFLNAAGPVLEQLMLEAGAAVILERRSVYVSLNVIDITDEAIALLDETLGSGLAPTQP